MRRRRAVAGANGYPLHGRERPGRARVRPREAMRPRFREKRTAYRNAARTKTDTGGRVQGYQGAREKPR